MPWPLQDGPPVPTGRDGALPYRTDRHDVPTGNRRLLRRHLPVTGSFTNDPYIGNRHASMSARWNCLFHVGADLCVRPSSSVSFSGVLALPSVM